MKGADRPDGMGVGHGLCHSPNAVEVTVARKGPRVSLAGLLLAGLVSGCYDYNGAEPEVREIPRELAWRTVNVNMHEVLPEWDPDYPFPEEPLSPPPNMTGCATGKNSLATGPPWSMRVETTLTEPDALETDRIHRGFAALEGRGYALIEKIPGSSSADKRAENDVGFFVSLRLDTASDGSRMYELISVSPCIRFDGDSQYE